MSKVIPSVLLGDSFFSHCTVQQTHDGAGACERPAVVRALYCVEHSQARRSLFQERV
jgi:hypothetical protein